LISPKITRRGVAMAAVAVCALPATAAAKPVITMSGSTTVAPLAALLAKKYLKVCHRCVTFKLLQGGSNVGVSDVAQSKVSIGNSSRDPQPSDAAGLVFNPIARDAVCIITNKQNTIGDLSQTAVQQIFGGKVGDWSQVPGATVSGPIQLFQRAVTSGTHDAFGKLFMAGKSVSSTAKPESSNGLVEQDVVSHPEAIGYVSLHFSNNVHPVTYQGVACNLRNAKSGQYAGVRNLYMVTRGSVVDGNSLPLPGSGAVGKWISWIRRSGLANNIVGSDWVPLH
jgi:phosphate transport system substrate-binding protein